MSATQRLNDLITNSVRFQPANMNVAAARNAARREVIVAHPGTFLDAMQEMGEEVDLSDSDTQLAVASLKNKYGDNPKRLFQEKLAEAKQRNASLRNASLRNASLRNASLRNASQHPSSLISEVLNQHPGLDQAVAMQHERQAAREE